ncbi:uncharacterized protein STEHIDRAFT_116130 [Stereum hirsutum FP-91666 SS1]|uniref:Uncharacterized protein n=1 Tax=Stereum hirsutum (strain FP-91666) TaxID=721885 RepID=R7RYM5_STEHR|nr:uncharacterized protein STEHIDRAFT_116130 [Stereum hirsutum FP-91666 SS1]EIM79923.1 hypothetical protein STEHIDRAFT_116130 [Stereum hirsutum FP-91666 SS1]
MPPILLRVVIFFVVVISLPTTALSSTNWSACLATVQNSTNTSGLFDNFHHPVTNASLATAVSYHTCTQTCGSGAESFEWSIFSQQFSAWLLPWLALFSQLPFGARLRSDNIMSVLLTVGSPALAGYSLAVTVLNSQWLAISEYEGSGLLASLVVLRVNDRWWKDLAEGLDYIHTWSVSAAASIAWVLVAYLFTVADSFSQIADALSDLNSNGESVGAVFLWLLPIVVGWLQVSPKCDFNRVKKALDKANEVAYVATSDPFTPIPASKISGRRAFSLRRFRRRSSLFRDEQSSAPICNYARVLPWNDAVETVAETFWYASENREMNVPVNSDVVRWDVGADVVAIVPGVGESDERMGSLARVERYCTTILAPTRAVYPPRSTSVHPREDSMAMLRDCEHSQEPRTPRWDHEVLKRMFIASLLGLALQWGTVGAGVVALWFTPATGLGCRSASFVLYASLATIVWFLMLVSSFLTHYSSFNDPSLSDRPSRRHLRISEHRSKLVGRIAIFLRRLGKVVATANATWIVTTCVLQFSTFYDRCYCNSSIFSRRGDAYVVLKLTPDVVPGLRTAWIGALVLALGSAFIYEAVLLTVIDPPLPDTES